MLAALACGGCRSSSSGNAWPWSGNSDATASSAWTPATRGAGGIEPGDPSSSMATMLQQQNQQALLAEQQRQLLAQMANQQQQQASQITALAEQKRQEELARLQQEAAQLAQQRQELESLAELRRRSLELDANNRDLHSQLAQSQQQNRLLEDQNQLLKQQLDDTATRLSSVMQSQTELARKVQVAEGETERLVALARQEAQQQIQALEANLKRRGGATIRANSSVQRNLTAVSIAGLEVREDGDVIRIELPADQIFAPGSASITPAATALVDRVADAVRQHYGRQMIGIEAHTDNGPQPGTAWTSHHQMSAAQAMAVFEQLTQRHQFAPQQLFVLGHGSNYPLASNGTPAGRQRNRRVEVVIYPESVDER